MTSSTAWYDETGAGPSESATSNGNFESVDAHDTGVLYQSNPIAQPGSVTVYSYERVLVLKWTGSYNSIDTVKFWKSGGSLSDVNLVLKVGTPVANAYAAPINTVSTIATTTMPTVVGSAFAVTTTGSAPTINTYYIYTQLQVPITVVTPGDIGSQTYTLQWNEA